MYAVEDINDYRGRITKEQSEELVNHCNKFKIYPDICAWYEDTEDFYSDWCEYIGLTQKQADYRLKEGTKETGEFVVFTNGEIVRLSI